MATSYGKAADDGLTSDAPDYLLNESICEPTHMLGNTNKGTMSA